MSDISAVTFGLQAFVTLLVILDPPGATPIFLGVLGNRTRAQRTLLAWQAAATSLFVITLFALFGQFIVNYLDISMPALQGAGGLLLLLVSLDLLKGHNESDIQSAEKNLALVPLGTPLLAGPGAIVTIMLFALVGVLWGVPYLFMKVAVEELSTPVIVFSRLLIGAAVLVPLAFYEKTLRPALKYWKYIALYAVAEMVIPWTLITSAQKDLSSGVVALLVATVPIWATLFAHHTGDSTAAHRTRIFGIALGSPPSNLTIKFVE